MLVCMVPGLAVASGAEGSPARRYAVSASFGPLLLRIPATFGIRWIRNLKPLLRRAWDANAAAMGPALALYLCRQKRRCMGQQVDGP